MGLPRLERRLLILASRNITFIDNKVIADTYTVE